VGAGAGGGAGPWGALDDVVDAQDHLGGLGGADEHLLLDAQRLRDAECAHVGDRARLQVCANRAKAGAGSGSGEGKGGRCGGGGGGGG